MTKEEFRKWRDGFGLIQDDLAKIFGVTRTTIQNWENGATSLPPTIEDLCAVWGERLTKQIPNYGPVVLCYADGEMFVNPYGPRRKLAMLQHEPFPTNAAAVARVRRLWNSAQFYNPFILTDKGKFLWNEIELGAVVRGEDKGAPTVRNTLTKLGTYVKASPSAFAKGPKSLTPAETQRRTRAIGEIGDKVLQLAADSESRDVSYAEFETLLDGLHDLGFYPTNRQVHDVAHAFQGEEVARAVA